MRSAKRLCAISLCILLVITSASCSNARNSIADRYIERLESMSESIVQEHAAAETQAETTPAVSETAATAAPKTETTPDTTGAAATLIPTKEDLETLSSLLAGNSFFAKDYDCRTDNILDFLYDDATAFELHALLDVGYLQEGKNFFDSFRTNAPFEYDPLGRFSNKYDPLITSVRADDLNEILEKCFCNTVYKFYTTGYDSYGNIGYYLHNGWYYFRWGGSGLEDVEFRAENCTEKDGRLYVTVNQYCFDYGIDGNILSEEICASLAVDAVLREENGKRFWSISSVTKTFSKYGS